MKGQELKERRLKLGLTQPGLAHLLGVKDNELYFGKLTHVLFQKK